MSLVTLNELMQDGCAIAGLVCLGWEEVCAFVEAAEAEDTGVALMVGPGARAAMPLAVWGKMMRERAEASDVPFALHLDHGQNLDEVKAALDAGFTSVMYDGSKLDLAENIANTREMVELAQANGASSEGEIGFVGYAQGAHSKGTDPAEARVFAEETGVDFMAVSVGNTHLQTEAGAVPDWNLLSELATLDVPLVIHGGSGFDAATRAKMAQDFNVRKFNIGTEIRQVFGTSLRAYLDENPESFDHLTILKSTQAPLRDAARRVIRNLKG